VKFPHAPHIHPRRSLGQNFLRDDNIARKIVTLFNPRKEDCVLEIGPGEGALTAQLVGRCGTLTVVEVDRRAATLLEKTYAARGVDVRHADFLSLDLDAFARSHQQRVRILGNIPYNITSPILFHVLDNRRVVEDLLIMVQKEVAQRMAAQPGSDDYGILSVFCGYCADVDLLFDVSPNAFYPKPQVISTVVRLAMREPAFLPARDERIFRLMVRSVFGKRRKTLKNSLRYFCEPRNVALPESPLLDRRPEELTIQQLVELSNTLTFSIRSDNSPANTR